MCQMVFGNRCSTYQSGLITILIYNVFRSTVLTIDPTAFTTSDNQGTIVDTGTTLTYLVAEAFDPFVNSITVAVSQLTTPVISKGKLFSYTKHKWDFS
ncbi:hypothetical protein Lser_V15G36004 [Lactuca serriola]